MKWRRIGPLLVLLGAWKANAQWNAYYYAPFADFVGNGGPEILGTSSDTSNPGATFTLTTGLACGTRILTWRKGDRVFPWSSETHALINGDWMGICETGYNENSGEVTFQRAFRSDHDGSGMQKLV